MAILDCFAVRLCSSREFDLALHCLAPRLRQICAKEPEEAIGEIKRLRAWVKTVPGWQRRIALCLWLNWFERRARSSGAEKAKKLAAEATKGSFPQPPRRGVAE